MASVNERFSFSTLLAVIDQGLTSGVNLVIGLLFIAFGSKSDYGLYAQLFALAMLSQALYSALISSPWATLGPKYRPRRARWLAAHLFRLQLGVAALLGMLAFAALTTLAPLIAPPELSLGVAAAFAALVPALWLREFAREFFFIQLRPAPALVVYALFAALCLLPLAAAAWAQHIDSATVFAVLALACAASGFWGLRRARLSPLANHGRSGPALASTWRHSRWTLPSVVLSWGFGNAHLFVAAWVIGAAATAELAAAKLLVMPAGVCVLGWSNIFLPYASRWLGRGELAHLGRMLAFSLLGLWSIILVYAVTLWLGYDMLLAYLLGEKYAGLLPLAMIWASYFILEAAVMGNNWILAAAGEYRLLFCYACVSFAITLPVIFVATHAYGTQGTLASLLCAQIGQLILLRGHGVPRIKREWARAQPAEPSHGSAT
jgi:O-antigen/teichoic acid export membrane protein